MRLTRFLMLTSIFLAFGVTATSSFGQSSDSRYYDQEDLSNPWSLAPWSFESSSLFLFRSDPGSKPLVSGLVNPANSVNADDLSYGFAYGYQLSLERQLTQKSRFETRFFGTDDFEDRSAQSTTPFDPLFVGGDVLSGDFVGFAGTTIQSRLASKLYSVELNMNHEVTENIEAIYGFRYLRLKDNLSLNVSDALLPASIQTEASNDLFGGQIGARGRLWKGRRLSLSTDFKGGIYGNGAHQRSSIAALGLSNYATANDFNDTVAFVGEWTLQGNYKLTDRWSVDLGYQLLWIDGVAVGTEQLGASDFQFAGVVGPGNGIDSHDHVFYQGIMFGVDYVW